MDRDLDLDSLLDTGGGLLDRDRDRDRERDLETDEDLDLDLRADRDLEVDRDLERVRDRDLEPTTSIYKFLLIHSWPNNQGEEKW